MKFAIQKRQLGTGHAVACSKPLWKNYDVYIMILIEDIPLIRTKTLVSALNLAYENYDYGVAGVVLTTILDRPFGYGRIVRGSNGEISRKVEEGDASEEERKIKEVNAGIYFFMLPSYYINSLAS